MRGDIFSSRPQIQFGTFRTHNETKTKQFFGCASVNAKELVAQYDFLRVCLALDLPRMVGMMLALSDQTLSAIR